MQTMQRFRAAWIAPRLRPTALRVTLVGSLLFLVNHGAAVLQGTMTALQVKQLL